MKAWRKYVDDHTETQWVEFCWRHGMWKNTVGDYTANYDAKGDFVREVFEHYTANTDRKSDTNKIQEKCNTVEVATRSLLNQLVLTPPSAATTTTLQARIPPRHHILVEEAPLVRGTELLIHDTHTHSSHIQRPSHCAWLLR